MMLFLPQPSKTLIEHIFPIYARIITCHSRANSRYFVAVVMQVALRQNWELISASENNLILRRRP
jgi:hypothetical protein